MDALCKIKSNQIKKNQIPAAAAPRKLLEGCGPAGRRLDESSDGVFEEDGEGEGV